MKKTLLVAFTFLFAISAFIYSPMLSHSQVLSEEELSNIEIDDETVIITAYDLEESIAFTDTEGTTYEEGVSYLHLAGLINGYDDGTFKPENTINRAEMIKIIVNGSLLYYGLPLEAIDEYEDDTCFDDVPANEWYTKYVCYAKAEGWVVGYENGKLYKPAQLVPFVEGLKMTLKGFNIDFVEETPWYKDAVDIASEGNFIPFTIKGFYDNLLRGEMADMIVRIIMDDEGLLEEYLGERQNIVVDYSTIEEGKDMSIIVPPSMEEMMFDIFFIEMDSEGEEDEIIGCGDKLHALKAGWEVPIASDTADLVKEVLDYFFMLDEMSFEYEGVELYNSLASSDLSVTSVTYNEETNSVEVNLTGDLMLGGVCDNPRIEAQLRAMVNQFGEFDNVYFVIDWVELEDLLSQE